MFSVLKVVFSILIFCPVITLSAPSVSSLGSDITLLINNDLLGPQSTTANSGILLLSPLTLQDSITTCEALGESLWSPFSKVEIGPNLKYLIYSGKYTEEQKFWIGLDGSGTGTIDGKGVFGGDGGDWGKDVKLPALCTQSAPFSNSTVQDSGERWRVSVNSNNEILTGFRDALSFRFLGIRYAPQPARFSYPTLYQGDGGNFSATQYGSKCVQSSNQGSEDCLFLNIWTPYLPSNPRSTTTTDLNPVLFFIHGGGYATGAGADPIYDGGNLVSRGDIVVITINYRLSTFGFLALDDGITNGNYGFADAVTALDWVQANIQDFGGDKERITIAGQSSGAATVRAMLGSPQARGKFVAAVPQSNLGGLKDGTYSLYRSIPEEVSETANSILSETNCTCATSNRTSQLDCLSNLPAYTIASLSTQAQTLVVDGTYITTSELILNGTGEIANIHLLMGTMRDEAGTAIKYPPTSTNFSTFLTSSSLNSSLVLNAGYTVPSTGNSSLDIFNATVRVNTDAEWKCIDQATVYAGLKNEIFKSIYYYEFNRSYAPVTDIAICKPPIEQGIYTNSPLGNPENEYFKCHGAQMYYIFGTLAYNGLPLRDGYDLPFEQFVVDSWSSFVRTYDPNPDTGFLEVRGFFNTTWEIEHAGRWEALDERLRLRELQWPSLERELGDTTQCEKLGLGLGYYLEN